MDAKALAALFADEVTVRHAGRDFVLKAPSTVEAAAVIGRFGTAAAALPEAADARVPYLDAVAEAVELTLAVEDGDLPAGIGRRIVLGTGGLASPVGQAAARLCGLPQTGAEAVPDDLPT